MAFFKWMANAHVGEDALFVSPGTTMIIIIAMFVTGGALWLIG